MALKHTRDSQVGASSMSPADTCAWVQVRCKAEAAAHEKALHAVQLAAAAAAEAAAAAIARAESERDAARATLACTEDRLHAALLVHSLPQTLQNTILQNRYFVKCAMACSGLKAHGHRDESSNASEYRCISLSQTDKEQCTPAINKCGASLQDGLRL